MSKALVTHTSVVSLEQRAENINRYNRCAKASAAQFASFLILTGMELKAAKKQLGETRGGDRKSNSGDQKCHSGTFDQWLEKNCPQVSRRAAYRYISVSEGCRGKMIKNADEKILALLDKSPSEFTDKESAIVHGEIKKATDGKTFNEFAQELGVIKKPRGSGTTGGNKNSGEKTDPAPTPDTPEKAALDIWSPIIRDLAQQGLKEKSWADLPSKTLKELKGLLIDLKEILPDKKS